MTTLADLTPEQRTECIGMWCDVEGFNEPQILVAVTDAYCKLLLVPESMEEIGNTSALVTKNQASPRRDLPRAWNPDGTPPAGKWETRVKTIGGLHTIKDSSRTRWVGEWRPTE